MSRYVRYIIDDIRDHTENDVVNESDNTGIEDSEFLRFLNDATYRLHSKIVQQHPSVFISEYETSVTGGTESYAIPDKAMLQNKVSMVEYSPTSLDQDYYPLFPGTLRHRARGSEANPLYYIRHTGRVYLSPIPNQSGTLRVHYIRKPSRLDLRRASIGSFTVDSNARTITALSFNVSTDTIDSTELNKYTSFCIVDKNGVIKMAGIPFDSINTTTGEVTISSGFTYESDESMAVGDYVVAGPYSSTHPDFPESIERYLIAYCAWKILKRDSSAESTEAIQELAEMEAEIVESYADIQDDIQPIPEIQSKPDSDHWDW